MNTSNAKRVGCNSSVAKAATLLLGASMLLTSFAPYLAMADDAPAPSADSSSLSAPASGTSTTSTDTSSSLNDPSKDPASPSAAPTSATATQDSLSLSQQSQTSAPDQAQPTDPKHATQTPTGSSVNPPTHPMAESVVSDGGESNQEPVGAVDGPEKNLPMIDQTTGALNNSYPITLPPGKDRLTPDLSLSYNSQQLDNSSVTGYGWSFTIPYITRVNKHGTDKLYTQTYPDFVSSESGELVQTSQTNPSNLDEGTYVPKSETGNFISYTYAGGVWSATDKTGTTYTYGSSAASRQDDATNSAHIFKWMLNEVRNTNNNYISYSYFKDQGQIYPDAISYTGHGSTAGIFSVSFGRSPVTNAYTSYSDGFQVTTADVTSSVSISVSGSIVRSYALTFATSPTLATRQLLSSIQESSTAGGVMATLPATSYTYQTTTAKGFTYSSSSAYSSPIAVGDGVESADVSGDGYPDLLLAQDFPASSTVERGTYTYNPATGTWVTDTARTVPTDIHFFIETPYDRWDGGTKVMDFNGDMLPDLLKNDEADPSTFYAAEMNNGLGWTSSSSWTTGMYGYTTADLNGDGLPDYIEDTSTGWGASTNLAFDNGSGFDVTVNPSHTYGSPVSNFDTPEGMTLGDVFADVNGDGLPDIIESYETIISAPPYATYTQKVFINTGTGWKYDPTWTLPTGVQFFTTGIYGNSSQPAYIVDVNHDGFADMIVSEGTIGFKVYINTGHSWVLDTDWYGGVDIDYGPSGKTTLIDDFNADGTPDVLQAGNPYPGSPNTGLWLNNNQNELDVLSTITSPAGAVTTVTYTPSTHYVDSSGNLLNPKLPLVIETVSGISTTDPVSGTTSSTTYSYSGGSYFYNNAFDRKFAGFNEVTTTDALGNTTKTYYHTGTGTDTAHGEYADNESKIGQVYRVENYDASGNLYQVVINKWDSSPTSGSGTFVFLAQTVTETYDGGTSHRDSAQSFTYDPTTGNLTQKIDWGEVTGADDGTFTDIGTDETVENFTYAVPVSGSAVTGAVSDDRRLDQTGTVVSDTTTAYDTLPAGSVSLGNATQASQLRGGSVYVSTSKAYDATGFVTSTTDADGNPTVYVPDAYELYPATVTDALGHSTHYTYDYASGRPATITDANGGATTIAYDGFGRTLTVTVPDPTTGAPVLKTAFAYVDTSGAISVDETDYMDSSVHANTYRYYDGLDRLIQTRVSNASNTYNVTDQSYDALGRVAQQSLPYFSSGSARTPATTDPTLYTTYAYDPMGRTVSSTDAAGTTTTAYLLWNVRTTDALGKVRNYGHDAYGNLIAVQEMNGGSAYTTIYTWDLNKDLTAIRDALGNVRNFTYDDLGQRLTAQDLHAPSDTTFGTWTYNYDPAGNLIHSISPKAATVNYAYDPLNRVLTENYTGAAGIEAAYTYDSCIDGIGRLCKVVTPSGQTKYDYNLLSNIVTEKDTVATTVYTSNFAFDRQGQTTTITYPDTSKVRYTYGAIGEPTEIDRKEATGAWTMVTAGINYSPTEQLTSEKFANGVVTTNTYDPTDLYRLTNKRTQSSAGVQLQNMTYGYDASGDVTTLTDASATDDAKTVNYAYDDLYRLIGATATGVASGPAYSETFKYNAIGDLVNKDGVPYTYGGSAGSSYANPNAPTKVGVANYTYDKDGNTLTYGSTVNTWNYKDQMLSTTNGTGTGTSTYAYDYQGNRISNTTASGTTVYPNKYYEVAGTKVDKEIFDGSTLIATVEKVGTGPVTPYYVHTDTVLGSNVISDATGHQDQLLDYYPFGDIRIDETATAFNEDHKAGGHIYDTSSDLDYLGARYMNAKTGQFLSEDPTFLAVGDQSALKSIGTSLNQVLADPQSTNSYSYVRNNPIIHTDPNGKCIEDLCIAEGIAAVGLFEAYEPQIASFAEGVGSDISQAFESTAKVGSATEGIANTVEETGTKIVGENGGLAKLSDDASGCRGGGCGADSLARGNGGALDNGKLTDLSVQSAPSTSLNQLIQSLKTASGEPYGKIGYTTVGQIRAAGGDVLSTPNAGNLFHSTISGITPQSLSSLMNVITNPLK